MQNNKDIHSQPGPQYPVDRWKEHAEPAGGDMTEPRWPIRRLKEEIRSFSLGSKLRWSESVLRKTPDVATLAHFPHFCVYILELKEIFDVGWWVALMMAAFHSGYLINSLTHWDN